MISQWNILTYANILDADYSANFIIGQHLKYNSIIIRIINILLTWIVWRCKIVKKVSNKIQTMNANSIEWIYLNLTEVH